MNADSFIKGVQRANANRLRRQVQQQQANAVNNKPVTIASVLSERTPVLAKPMLTALQPVIQQATQLEAIKPEFNLEAYRLDIIAKAIAHILKQQKGI
ncbi:hypothetical protein [Pseudomonas putida]|uniref:Uncharacterized protein n=1 Tax=Pseudomonas putida TaxID=303 RepID=A0AAW6PQV1_PSEPU|nr:hypothetical protein [Pseudomonas putida]MDF3871060.1 hypothetical protein [Pseudomonas putida]MDF3876864.1 hypothetical protein [Pseudomonas putida]